MFIGGLGLGGVVLVEGSLVDLLLVRYLKRGVDPLVTRGYLWLPVVTFAVRLESSVV